MDSKIRQYEISSKREFCCGLGSDAVHSNNKILYPKLMYSMGAWRLNNTMQELSDFPYQVTGEKRQQALNACLSTIQDWGLTMPAVEPLVMDFGLGRFDEIGEIEFWVANEEQAGYCGKFLFVQDEQTCPYHEHERKHETFFVVKGKVLMVVNDQVKIMNEGDILVMPPGDRHSFTGIGPALLLEVSMPSTRQDNFFTDKAIGESGVI
jgi:mannose-6-phosphate isomerase-like protein (cupin superfamily)